ncbi:hypothetical protein GQ44DRAFT_833103 [Phaeosphaeriaceae sp. PMI808]|nr:hypothetical protein GQ44DRAFT_833103 [Phaeosphaeriaceae sp. PMI808]
MAKEFEKVVRAYQAHWDSIPPEKQINLGVPGKPNLHLRLDDSLALPVSSHGKPETTKCPNSVPRKKNWLAAPHPYRKGYGYSLLLGHICAAAELRQCERKECVEKRKIMEQVAPECKWRGFRDWAVLAMSCQQAFTMEQKMSTAHTHIANAAYTCAVLTGSVKDRKKDFIGGPKMEAIMMGVSNVVFWMVTIQRSMGLSPYFYDGWGHRYLPESITVPAICTALREVQTLKVCRNRLWNVLELSERKQDDLPDFVRSLQLHPLIRHNDHDLCTQTRCQGAHLDSTRVGQMHKCPKASRPKSEDICEPTEFPINLLVPAVEGGQTAWLKNGKRLISSGESYVALSHVWSDGTGVGREDQGSVNSCLWKCFASVATTLKCDGIWWDAISVPLDPKVRGLALSRMHTNYADAKCTVVHDRFLLGLEWKSSENACLALVMSPWFTRGWTALELAMSSNVQVLFKSKSDDPMKPDIRDLETEILASDPGTASGAHWLASCAIRRLRGSVSRLSDLLAILRPRSTSWVRDRTVIAALLTAIPNLNLALNESEITQSLLKHLRLVPHQVLLHGRPTMSDLGGFSWCPTTLDDMPIEIGHKSGEGDEMLVVESDGSITGSWLARPVSPPDVRKGRLQPHGSDISVIVKVEAALFNWKSCLVLYQGYQSDGPALLVTTVGVDAKDVSDPIVDCRYVGAVRDFRQSHERGIINIAKWTGDQDFRTAEQKAMDDDDDNTGSRSSGGTSSIDEEDDDSDESSTKASGYNNDSDGDGDSDYNNFYGFEIRLGRENGQEGVRAWDILKEAWAVNNDKSWTWKDDGDSENEIEMPGFDENFLDLLAGQSFRKSKR